MDTALNIVGLVVAIVEMLFMVATMGGTVLVTYYYIAHGW